MNSIIKLTLSLLLVGSLGFIIGCEDDDDDSSASGNSVIQGNIAAFSSTADKGIAGDSKAAIEGITVRINGLNIKTTTGPDGSFILTGVPAGDWTLVIVVNGVQVTYPVTVGESEKVVLSNIVVTEEGAVVVGNIASIPIDTPVDGGEATEEEDDGDDEAEGPKLVALSVNHDGKELFAGLTPAFNPNTLSYVYPAVYAFSEVEFAIEANGAKGSDVNVTIDGEPVGEGGTEAVIFSAYGRSAGPGGASASFDIPIVVTDVSGGKTTYKVKLTVTEPSE